MNKLSLLFIIGALFCSVTVAVQSTCNVLIVQGGTTQGHYAAGAIQGLVKSLPQGQAAWDVVSGVGSGALTAALAGQYAKGQEAAMAQHVVSFWQNLEPKNLWKNWLTGIVQGLLVEPGLYNSAPADTFLKSTFPNPPNARFFSIGATNANDASYHLYSNFNGAIDANSFQAAIKATWATPGILPYVNFGGMTLIDGSILKNLDVAAGVQKCRQLVGNKDSAINVDTILLHEKAWSANVHANKTHTLAMLELTLKLTSFRTTMYDIEKSKWDYPNVNWRYHVFPSQNLPGNSAPYEFNAKDKTAMINLGISDAQKSVAAGPGAMWDEYSSHVSAYLYNSFGAGATLQNGEEHQQMVELLRQAFAEEAANIQASQQ